MKRKTNRVTFGIIAFLIISALIWAFRPNPVAVEIASITRGPLQVTVNEDGRTRIKERYIVSTPLGGRLHRVELHPGDTVEASKTLITAIDPTDPELLDPRTRAQAEARVKTANATLMQAGPLLQRALAAHEFAQNELKRARTLETDGTISIQQLDAAEQKERITREELKAAEFSLQIAKYELELTKAALMHTSADANSDSTSWHFSIRSPINGRVLRVFQESAAVVPAGARLLELGDPADLEVEIDVLSADAVKIRPGAKVYLEHWGGDAPLLGRVRLVEPAGFLKTSALGVEEQRVNVIVDFTDPFEKRATLGDAFRVEARIVIWDQSDIVKVPAGALFRFDEDWAVFTVVNGKAKLQPVAIGQRNDLEAEIREGLAEGARVIVHPSDKVSEGTRVRPR